MIKCSNPKFFSIVENALKTQNYSKILKLIERHDDLEIYSNDPFMSKIYADQTGVVNYTFNTIKNQFPMFDSYQFAFISNNKVKCLYSPNNELVLPSSNYLKKGIFCEKQNKFNDYWYKKIVDALRTDELSDKLVNSFLNESFVSKFFIGKKVKKIVKPEIVQGIITPYNGVSVMHEYTIAKKTLVSLINDYKIVAEPFENFPFVSISCESKDYSKLEKQICNNFPVCMQKQSIVNLPRIVKSDIKMRTHTNLNQIGAYDAHNLTKGKSVKVGVIDTGIDYNHDELKQLFVDCKGYNFVNEYDDPLDDNGHGSHVAGIIGGLSTGVAPECTLYSLKVLNEYGAGSNISVLKAIDWSISNNLDVLNLSLGSPSSSELEKRVIKKALENGICIVAAAGNSGVNEYFFPASYDNVISVSAVDSDNNIADFSTYNDQISIAAPGVEIFSTYMNNSYQVFSGTSMASPHVAGVIALIKSLKSFSPEELSESVFRTADSLHNSLHFGAGLVRADKAVLELNPELVITKPVVEPININPNINWDWWLVK